MKFAVYAPLAEKISSIFAFASDSEMPFFSATLLARESRLPAADLKSSGVSSGNSALRAALASSIPILMCGGLDGLVTRVSAEGGFVYEVMFLPGN